MTRMFLVTVAALSLTLACGGDDDGGSSSGGAGGATGGSGGSTGGAAGNASGGSAGSSTGGSGGSAGSATGGTAGSASGGAAGASSCTSIALQGTPVPETAGVGSYPAAQGGTIADGTYVLTQFEIYPPGSVDAYKRTQTIVVSGNKVEAVTKRDNEPEQRSSGTWTAAGTELTISVTCPQSATIKQSYTASPTELKFFESDTTTTNEVHTFTKK